MASLRKRPKSECWVCCYTTADGRRTQRSTGSTDKDEAMMVCRRWESEARMERESAEAAVAAGGVADGTKGRRWVWAAAMLAVLLQLGIFWWYSNRETGPVPLLVEMDESEGVPERFSEQQYAKRHRWVRINEEALKAFEEKEWEFTLNLFDDEKHRVDVMAYRKHYHGAKSVVGLIESDLHTSVVLSKRDSRRNVMAGTVALADGRRFLITHVGEGKHVVIEIDVDVVPGAGNRTITPAPAPIPEADKEGVGVGANDHRYGEPTTDLASAAKRMDSQGLARRMMAAAGINPSNAPFGFYGRGGTSSGTGLTQGPTTPARILYQRAGTTEYIDVLFVYEENMLVASFNNDVKDLQLKLDNLLEETNLIFKKCLIPLELRQAVLDSTNTDPTSGEPIEANNMLFKATAREWTGGAGNSTAAMANIDGFAQTIGVIPGTEGPAWKMDTNATKPIYDSIVGSATRGRWTTQPAMGVFSPLYETPNFAGDSDAAMDWITDPRNSLIFGDQYWPEPYINLPEGYQWRLLPVALDSNATYNVDATQSPPPDNVPGRARADFTVMDYTSIENPDIFSGPIDSGIYDNTNNDKWSQAVTPLRANFTSPYGDTGDKAKDMNGTIRAFGAVPIWMTAEDRSYLDENDGGSLQQTIPGGIFTGIYPRHIGLPVTDPGQASAGRDQMRPNYYLFNEDPDDMYDTYNSKGSGVEGVVDTNLDHFTATDLTLTDGNETSFSDIHSHPSHGHVGIVLVMPNTLEWLDFRDRIWAREIGTKMYTFHYNQAGAQRTLALETGFDINATHNFLSKVNHNLTDGQQFESNTTLIPLNRPLYIEKIDANRTYLRTTSGFAPAGSGIITTRRINARRSEYGGGVSLTQTGIDTFFITNHGLQTGDQVFITEGRNNDFPTVAGGVAGVASTTVSRKTAYEVYRWDSDNVSLHRIKDRTQTPRLVHFGLYSGADVNEEKNAMVLESAKSGDIYAVAGGAATFIPPGTAPSFVTHPQDVNSTSGSMVTLIANVLGSNPITYKWQKDGVDINSSTTSTLSLPNAQGSVSGTYRVIAINSDGNATSNGAVVSVTGSGGSMPGYKVWEYLTGGQVYSSPAMDANGTIYIGSNDSKVYALHGVTGAKIWSHDLNGTVEHAPLVDGNGYVYAGGGQKVYALEYREIVPSGLILHYPFDSNGTLDAARGGGDQNATRLPDPANNNAPVKTPDRYGAANEAFLFDGVDDSIRSSNTGGNSNLTYVNHTMSVWVKTSNPGTLPSGKGIMGSLGLTSGKWGQMLLRDGKLEVEVGWLDTTKNYRANTIINDDKWHHLAYTFDATSQALVLYVDGVLQKSVNKLSDPVLSGFSSSHQFTVGTDKNGNFHFPGSIDDARVYTRVLTDSDVRYLSGLGNTSQVSVRWETDLGLAKTGAVRTVSTSPSIDANGTIYIGANDGNLFALNGDTGVKIWDYAANAALSDSSPVVDINGTVIFGSTDNYLRALDPNPISSVRRVFEDDLNADVESSAAVGADGTIYVGSNDGKLYAYNPDGTKKWEFTTAPLGSVRSSPRVENNGTNELIYFGSDNDKVYALTTAGTKYWEFDTGSDVRTRPLVDENGTVYVTDSNTTLYALDYNATSNIVSTNWTFDINGTGTSPVMDQNGTIYVGSSDGNVYAVLPPPRDGSFTDLRDGNVYGTKRMAGQLWMTSNLRYNMAASFAPGGNNGLVSTHGRLYTWADLTLAIPTGWRLPTDAEWQALETSLGMPGGDLGLNGVNVNRGLSVAPTIGNKLMVGGNSGLNFYPSGYRTTTAPNFRQDNNGTYLWLGDTVGANPWRRKIVKVAQVGETVDSVCRFSISNANLAESVRLIRDNKGSALWVFATGGAVESDPVLSDDNATLYIGSDANRAFALRTLASAPRQRWQFNSLAPVKAAVRPSANGNIIYVGADSNKLFALNDSTGGKIWEFDTTAAVRTQPVVDGNGTIYFGSSDRKIYAVLSGGTKSWDFLTGESVLSSPVIDANATLYCGSNDNFLHAVDISEVIITPTLKWRFDANGPIYSSPALDPNGNIYFGSADQNLYALDYNGTLRWSFATGDIIRSSPALDSSGVVYFGSNDGKVYALDSNGTKLWESANLGNLVRSSVAVGADGTIFAATLGGRLYALSAPGNGSEIWHYPDLSKTPPDAAMGAVRSSPTISNNGYVIFGAQDNKVYAVASTAGGLNKSLWPKHRGNRMNMGRMLPIPTVGLTSYYPFDNDASDAIITSGRNGTFSIPGVSFVNDRNNKQNFAVQVDYNATGGTGSPQPNIRTSAPTLPDCNSTSVALWAKWRGAKTGAWAGETAYMFSDVGSGDPTGLTAFAVSILNNGDMRFHTKQAPAATSDILTLPSGNNLLTDNQWHHVTVVADRDLDVKRIYIDGVMRVENNTWTDATANAGAGTHGPLNIGALGNSGDQVQSWNGSLDEVRIYDRALTPSEVVQIYTSEARTNPTIDPPSVISEPLDVNGTAGARVGFRVNAVGGFPLTYQWKKDGIDISGATNPSYLINNVQGGNSGSYTVSVANGQGSVVSTVTDLNVTGGSQLSANVISVSSAIRPNFRPPAPGRLWVADGTGADGYFIRRMDANRSITTLAGGGVRTLADLNGSNTDFNGSATIARFTHIADVAADGGGGPTIDSRVYIAGENNKIFRLDPDGSLHLIAGGGTLDANGTNLAINCKLGNVVSVATDHNGSRIIVADTNATSQYHVFSINTETGTMTRLIGGGINDIDADMTNALNCRINNIDDVTVDSTGLVYFSDNQRGTVLRLNGAGLVRVAGVPAIDPNFRTEVLDGRPSLSGRVAAESLASDANGTVYIAGRAWDFTANTYLAGSPHRVRQIVHDANTTISALPTPLQPVIKTIGGGGTDDPSLSKTIFATSALLSNVTEVAVDSEINVFIDDVNASTSTVWKVDAIREGPMPWTDGEVIYLVDTNASDPTAWPALPPYKGYTFPANMRTAASGLSYHGPYWVNVDANTTTNPHGNRFVLSTSPNGRFINGTWTNFGNSNTQPYVTADSVLIGKGSFYVVQGNSMDMIITDDGDTTCDLVKTSRFDMLTDSSDFNMTHSRQVDFTYRRGDSFMNGANPLVITPGNFDPKFSGIIGVTTNNTVISVGGLRMALNNTPMTSKATAFGGLKTESQRYSIAHDANGSFRFNGDLYETPQRIMDARADLVCLLISGDGGGLGQYYTKSSRGTSAIPDMVENATRMEDMKRIDHPNVLRNRDGINYSVCQWDGSLPYYIFAAEVAHNLAAGHGVGDRNANVGVPVNPMDYKNTGISQGQDNTTFSPFRNDRIAAPEFPAGSGALVKDNYIALGTYFTARNGSQGKFGTISVYAGLPGGRPAFRTVGLFSTPLVYYQGTNIGQQYGWRIPPPNGRYNEPLEFDNSKAMTTIGTIAAFYRDANGAGRAAPDDVVVPTAPKGIISLAHPGKGSSANTPNPISYAPGVQPIPGVFPPGTVRMASPATTGGRSIGAVTNPTPAPKPKPTGLPAVTTPTPPNPKPGTGLGGTINPAPPTVPTTAGLPNDNYASVWPPAGQPITAPGAVFPARDLAVVDSTNRGATREQQHDSPLAGGRTVWFRWNAPAAPKGNGFVTFSTKGSDFDTIIKVVWNDPDPAGKGGYNVQDNTRTGPWSEGRYPWKPNQVFLIAVDGVSGAQGTIRISAQIE